jgi:gas vesicle protein
MTTTTKIVLGVVGAAAAGMLIGLLIAPEKGSETRKRIRKTTGEWADGLSQLFVKGKEEAENLKEDLKEDLKDKGRHAKSAAEDKVNKIKESFS